MPVGDEFRAAVEGKPRVERKRRKPAPPFSLRLSAADRMRLTEEAAGAPLGAYIRAKALGERAPSRARRTGLPVEDRKALARALALLGRSRLASNLNQFAHAANRGALLATPEIEAELLAACLDIRDIRRLLLTALGLKAGEAPSSFAAASEDA